MTAIGEKNIQVHVVVNIHVYWPNLGTACYTCMLTFAVRPLFFYFLFLRLIKLQLIPLQVGT